MKTCMSTNQETEDLNNIVYKLKITYIYRTFHATAEYTLL